MLVLVQIDNLTGILLWCVAGAVYPRRARKSARSENLR